MKGLVRGRFGRWGSMPRRVRISVAAARLGILGGLVIGIVGSSVVVDESTGVPGKACKEDEDEDCAASVAESESEPESESGVEGLLGDGVCMREFGIPGHPRRFFSPTQHILASSASSSLSRWGMISMSFSLVV